MKLFRRRKYYRIVKYTNRFDGSVKYTVERKKFLFGWVNVIDDEFGIMSSVGNWFSTFEKADRFLDSFVNGPEIEVQKTFVA